MILTENDPRHGSLGAYTNHRCRCQRCRDAYSRYQVPIRQAFRQHGLEPDDPRHGTDNGYTNYGCRCPDCTDARSEARSTRKGPQVGI